MSNDLTKYEVSAVAQKAGCAWLHEPLAQRFAALCRAPLVAELEQAKKDAERYRWLAGHCRSTSEHWGGRWSIVVDGPAPKSHDSEDDFDAAIDAAIAKEQS